jgi:Flp pilus assembly protein CpaB
MKKPEANRPGSPGRSHCDAVIAYRWPIGYVQQRLHLEMLPCVPAIVRQANDMNPQVALRRWLKNRWLVSAGLVGIIALGAMQIAFGQPLRAMPLRVLEMDVASGLIKPDEIVDILAFVPGKATTYSMKGIRVLANEIRVDMKKGGKESLVTVSVTAQQAEQLDAIHSAGHQFRLVLSKGKTYRAVAIKTTGKDEVAEFIMPGSHVDLVISPIKNNDKRRTAILQNLHVLACSAKASPVAADQKDAPEKRPEEKDFIATLEVTPEQAEQLIVAQAVGDTFRLLLRGLAIPPKRAEHDK